MFNRPRQLLTTGTAMAAVAGALLLGAEDAGLGPYTRAHVDGLSSSWWDAPQGVAHRPVTSHRSPTSRRTADSR